MTQTVHVLNVNHRHGSNVEVFSTYESAFASLVAYCREWWPSECDGDAPESDTDLVSEYFETMNYSESYELTPATVR